MTFNTDDLFASSGIKLEKTAADKFGAAVEDFKKQGSALPAASTPQSTINPSTAVTTGNERTWDSVQYAAEMVSLAPKHRFLFKVHFHFNAPYVCDRDSTIFSYLIKNITRPKINFEYLDVNMYNFHTKVLTNIKHEPMSIEFYDDIGNNVQEFFNTYRRSYSPIARTATPVTSAQFETSGMDFASPDATNIKGGDFSATMGQLLQNTVNVLHYIELEQFFGHGTQKNVFKFINPRVESFDFDESSFDGQDLHNLKISFNYDALIIDTETSQGEAKGALGTRDIMSETSSKSSMMPKGSVKPIVNPSGVGSMNSPAQKIDIFTPNAPTNKINFDDFDDTQSFTDISAKKTLLSAAQAANQGSAGVTRASQYENPPGAFDEPVISI